VRPVPFSANSSPCKTTFHRPTSRSSVSWARARPPWAGWSPNILRFEFLDTDELIQARTGRTIADIFARDGEPAFRELERQIVFTSWPRAKKPSLPPAAASRPMPKISPP
jgi:hypothetical protein